MKTKLRFYTIELAIVLIGLGIGVSLAIKEQHEINQQLAEFDQSLALSILPSDIMALSGTVRDLQLPEYKKIKQLLREAQTIKSQSEYIYLFGQNADEQIFFYADNEDPENIDDYSPPGQVYDEATQEDKLPFIDHEPRTFASTDRWGRWVTASSPIINPDTGDVLATVNIDMPQRIYYGRMVTTGAVPFLTSLIFALALWVYYKVSVAQERLLLQRAEYISVTAHDLKSPLNGIEWLVQTMRKHVTADVELSTNLGKIEAATKEMLASIDDVVNASSTHLGKVATGNRQAVDVSGLTQKVLANLALSIQQKQLQVKTELSAGVEVSVDNDALRRAIGNVLSNAIKYSKIGGTIEIGSAKHGDKVMWQITDHGVGIPEDEQKKVLTGYYRASNVKNQGIPGSGLGLFYTKKVIEAHGGKLLLNSTDGQGTTVVFNLPSAS